VIDKGIEMLMLFPEILIPYSVFAGFISVVIFRAFYDMGV